MRRVEWECRMFDNQITRRQFEIALRSETEIVVLALRGRIDPGALIAAERPFLVIAGDNILAKFRADGFKEVAEMTDDREVPKNGMPALYEIVDNDCSQHGDYREQ